MGLLRILLAISVLLSHTRPVMGVSLIGGFSAVEVFFIISGFYMALILDKKYPPGSTGLFYLNRLLRLFPLYVLVLIATLIAQTYFGNHFLNIWPWPEPGAAPSTPFPSTIVCWQMVNLHPATAIYLFLANIFCIGLDTTSLFTVDTTTGLFSFAQGDTTTHVPAQFFVVVPPAWTLGMEFLFYLIAPFIVRRSNLLIMALILLSASLWAAARILDPSTLWSHGAFPVELFLFLLGTLSYKFFSSHQKFIATHPYLAAVLIANMFIVIIGHGHLPIPAGFNGLYLYFSVMVAIPFLFAFTQRNRIDRYIGELSFPFYISHEFIIMLMAGFSLFNPLLACVFVFVVSIFLNHLIDRPIDRMRQSLVRHVAPRPDKLTIAPHLRS